MNRRTHLLILMTLASCGDNSSSKDPEPPVVTTTVFDGSKDGSGKTEPSEDPGKQNQKTIDEYYPETKNEWFRGKPSFRNLSKDDVPAADDYFRWFEAIYDNWDKTIVAGHAPQTYLARFPNAPEGILFVDDTKGSVPGIEKLKAVVPEMLKRCPSLGETRFKAPLEVHWEDKNQPGTTGDFLGVDVRIMQEPGAPALPAAPLLWASRLNIKGEYVKPANTPQGWYGYQYPSQTFLELTGGKTWAEGAFAQQSLDQTFSHEYGHFLVQAWSLNMGRNPVQSFMFAEFFAELTRTLCWGSYLDDPTRIASEISHDETVGRVSDPRPFNSLEGTYKNASRRLVTYLNYKLYSLEQLIIWEKHHARFDSDKMFRAVFATMEAMTGRMIKTYPAMSELEGIPLIEMSPWSRQLDKDVVEKAPMMFTRQEFLEKFCDHYPCGDLRYLVEADAEGNRKSEW